MSQQPETNSLTQKNWQDPNHNTEAKTLCRKYIKTSVSILKVNGTSK